MAEDRNGGGGAARDVSARLAEAVAHHRAGRLQDAARAYDAVLALQPRHADALHLLGVLAIQAGQPATAVELIGRAIAQAGDIADYHDNLGSALAAAGRPADAVAAHRRALALRPDSAPARFNLGNALHAAGRPDRAAAAFRGALALRPDYTKAWYNCGNALRDAGDAARTVTAFARAAALEPGMAEARNNLGDALAAVGRLDESVAQHRAVVHLRPDDATAWYNLGTALQQKAAYEEAEIAYREALRRAPGHVGALNNLGSVLKRLGRPDQAEACHRLALKHRPDFAEALYNLGNALQAQGKLAQAAETYEEALARKPDLATASYNLALLALHHGDLPRGWFGYDRRFAAGEARPDRRIPLPRWRGEPMDGRRLLVWREQGVGDEILFASCYGESAATGGAVVIEADRRLVSLLARSFPAATVRAERCDAAGAEPAEPPDADAQVPAGTLPRHLRGNLARFPARPSWLVPDPARMAAWRERMAAAGPGLKVGIGWRSSLMTQERRGAYTALADWGALFAVPGVEWVNLQYDDCAAEITDAEARFGVRIHRWADLDLKDDFEATAALMANLDLVISPAMSAGELAGALGVPVWRFGAPDWTWLGTGVRPWFPSMRVFAPRPGEGLVAVLSRMATALRSLAGTPRHGTPEPAAAMPPTAADDGQAEAHLTAAMAAHRAGRLADAEAGYHAVLRLRGDHADALHLLGLVYHQAGLHSDALAWLDKALGVEPDFPLAWNHRGLVLQALGDRAAAQEAFARAVAQRPDFADALTHLGLLVQGRGAWDAAERWHRRAIRLQPDNAAAHANLGYVDEQRGRFAAADGHYRRTLALRPDLPDALNNRGTMDRVLERPGDGVRYLERALRVDPGFALAGWNLGLLHLARGDLAQGWDGYDRRFSARQLQKARQIPVPRWTGNRLAGRRLLVWNEQGLGDEILFASCYRDLERAGGPVVLECDRRLVSLFARAFPRATVRAETVDARGGETIDPPDVDVQCPAGSLPRLLRDRPDRFPAAPAFLAPDPERAALWRERVAATGPGLRVGIAWRSQVVTAHRERSYISLGDWAPVLAVPGVQAITLQYGDCAAEIADAEARFGVRIHRWADLDLKDDLEGVAALVANLDLVLTPSMAIGELAGALGVPVWRIGVRDWTWLGTGVRPWFPSMRAFAARPGEELRDVPRRIARLLTAMAGGPTGSGPWRPAPPAAVRPDRG
ncbi:tetratricopeptide repeat protein [Azospirillum halopraeferens]|uniref:tetratricopeptide repeat protein n=1 Tax=Azospirillum halopraeferens TaxID=34010 RepID=UPI000A074D8D|nr:tetratricopeptide repeat protein [Azospirillum halopraeferens]